MFSATIRIANDGNRLVNYQLAGLNQLARRGLRDAVWRTGRSAYRRTGGSKCTRGETMLCATINNAWQWREQREKRRIMAVRGSLWCSTFLLPARFYTAVTVPSAVVNFVVSVAIDTISREREKEKERKREREREFYCHFYTGHGLLRTVSFSFDNVVFHRR